MKTTRGALILTRPLSRSERSRAVWLAGSRAIHAGLRLSFRGLVGCCCLAAVLGSFGGPDLERQSGGPAPGLPASVLLCQPLFDVTGHPPEVLDPGSGRTEPSPLPFGHRLRHASFSPWRDPHGRRQLAGQFWDRSLHTLFLLRASYPAGETLDLIAIESSLGAPPCWDPGRSSRVLIATLGGDLYRVDFGVRETGRDEPALCPVRLDSGDGLPRPGRFFIGDPCASADPRLGGRIIVNLSHASRLGDRIVRSAARLWWLKLDPEWSSVVSAGPLVVDDVADPSMSPDVDDERQVVTGAPGAGGSLIVAYLVPSALRWASGTGQRYELRCAPVHIDPRTGDPSFLASEVRTLADDCAGIAPVPSEDGRRFIYWRCAIGPSGLRTVPEMKTVPIPLGFGLKQNHSGSSPLGAHGGGGSAKMEPAGLVEKPCPRWEDPDGRNTGDSPKPLDPAP